MKQFLRLSLYWLFLVIVFFLVNYFNLVVSESNLFLLYFFLFLIVPVIFFLLIYFYKNKYKKGDNDYRQKIDIFFYLVLFYFVPFIILASQLIIKDIGWFVLYTFFIFPITFIIFVLLYKSRYKNKIDNFRRHFVFLLVVFVSLLIISIIYLYAIVAIMFANSKGFPF